MSLRIQTNVEALNAHRNLVNVNDSVSKSMERLSSGFRINTRFRRRRRPRHLGEDARADQRPGPGPAQHPGRPSRSSRRRKAP